MTLHTESRITMRKTRIILLVAFMLATSAALADVIDGTWKFEKALEYHGLLKNVAPPPEYRTVQIVNGELGLPPKCYVGLKKAEYAYGRSFQPLSKAGAEENSIADYLQKQFGFKLSEVQYSYTADPDMSDCNNLGQEILVSRDKVIVIRGASIFFSYTRSDGGTGKAISKDVPLYGHKLSHLPFIDDNYMWRCVERALTTRIPKSTTKCAPVYYPYAVSKKDTDPLSVLIGTHKYLAGGARRTNDEDYDNPLSNGLHPVFILLPPLGDVLLVRVDDLETSDDSREGIGGANLAIKNGRVTDQLNVPCNWDEQHYCRFDDGKAHYQLLESGKFKKLD
jgi:hypothetical protein